LSLPVLPSVRTFQVAGSRKSGSILILMTGRTLRTAMNLQSARTWKSHPSPTVDPVDLLSGRIPLSVQGCRPTDRRAPSPALRASDFGRAARDWKVGARRFSLPPMW